MGSDSSTYCEETVFLGRATQEKGNRGSSEAGWMD